MQTTGAFTMTQPHQLIEPVMQGEPVTLRSGKPTFPRSFHVFPAIINALTAATNGRTIRRRHRARLVDVLVELADGGFVLSWSVAHNGTLPPGQGPAAFVVDLVGSLAPSFSSSVAAPAATPLTWPLLWEWAATR